MVGLSLRVARDVARDGIRCNGSAPGLFETPMMRGLPEKVREGIQRQIENPKRCGLPEDYARLALAIIDNPYLNGEAIRLDAASRLPPR